MNRGLGQDFGVRVAAMTRAAKHDSKLKHTMHHLRESRAPFLNGVQAQANLKPKLDTQ